MEIGITSTYTLTRDDDGYTTSITWTFKKYNNSTEQERTVTDPDTNEEITGTVRVYDEADLVDTQSVTYNIPVDQRTTATHEEPHVHDNEMAFQAAYRTWADSHKNSEAGQAFWNTFGTL